jgi:NAD(P)-dependent dehydrogenase (short-subunit alcohol dehydrogenase family)
MTPAPLDDRVVMIAGASGALGRATAAAFAQLGDRLALCGRDRDRLAGVAAEVGIAPDRWVAAVGDLREPDAARSAVATAIEAFGRIDILVHVLGGYAGGTPVVELDQEETRTMLDQHLWTTLNLVQAVVPGMVERGWGRVVAASSVAAANAPARAAHYAAAKAAEETLLRSLAKEVAPHGLTINVVAIRAIDEQHERETAPTPKNAPWTTPEEIAATFLFLCSDAAAAINGARIPLDGR